MFKFIHVTDTHFGLETHGTENPLTGLNTRAEDGLQAFDQMIDFAIVNDIKFVVHSGDVFNTKTVNQTVVNAFYERILRLSREGIKVFILQGNHDASRVLQRKNGLDLANVVDIPGVTVTRGGDYYDFQDIQIVTVSYWNTAEEIAQQINDLAKRIDWKRPAILVVHLQIEYANFPGSFKADLPFTPLAALTSHPWTYVAAGHIHKPQKLNENPPVYYGGSLVRCSAAESNDPKGFMVIEVEGTKAVNIYQQEVDCLKFVTLKGTMAKIKSIMEGRNGDFSKVIVRLKIEESEDPIDDAFIKEKFGSAFKYTIEKESATKVQSRVVASAGISMEAYLQSYFEKDDDKDELIALIEELRHEDEVVAVTER